MARQHGESYLTLAPRDFITTLAADFMDLSACLDIEHDPVRERDQLRAGAQMAALMAMSLTNMGQHSGAHRWWNTARAAADRSTDPTVRVWVRGEEGIRVLYTNRAPRIAVVLADEVLAIGGTRLAGKALACKAQALALMGDRDDAAEAVRAIEPAFTQMPATVVDDDATVYGWPEHCLRHAESYVHSHLGETAAAVSAQERALVLTPPGELRARTLLHLHRALCLVQDGDIGNGCDHAIDAITALPATQRTRLVDQIAHRIVRTVPSAERSLMAPLVEALASGQP